MLAYATEKRYFVWFNAISLSVFALMCVLWSNEGLTPWFGAFAIVWLCLALLVGLFNGVAAITHGTGFPLGTALVVLAFITGGRDRQHAVVLQERNTELVMARRGLEDHLNDWLARNVDTTKTDTVPMVFVLADGGASRSGYWVARVLERLHCSDTTFQRRLFMLSGASGGAVGIASYYQRASSYQQWDSLPKDFPTDDALAKDMLTPTLAHMLGPDLGYLLLAVGHDRAHALERALERSDPLWQESVRMLFDPSRTKNRPALFLNTTCMNNGQPGIVSSIDLGAGVSKRIDVLDSLPGNVDMHLSTAAVLSARFPYISPAGFMEWNGRKHYFVDGGYFDNSGAGVTIEVLQAIVRKDSTNSWSKRIRPVVVHISNTAPQRRNGDGGVHQLANELAAPGITVLGTYASQTNINDDRLKACLDRDFKDRSRYVSINLYEGEQASALEFSMSWSMSDVMRCTMDSLALDHPEILRAYNWLY